MVLNQLYFITDKNQTRGRSLVEVVESALQGGVRMVQLREKDLSGKELFNIARELRSLTNQYNAKLLINDRIDIALAVSADGVHLGRKSISVQDARKAFEMPSLIGVSTHSLEEALQAKSDGADFITFGPIYYTPSKTIYGAPVGVDKLREAAEEVDIPVYALGGVKRDNIKEVLSSGAYGVAMISAIMVADDVKKVSEDLIMRIADH